MSEDPKARKDKAIVVSSLSLSQQDWNYLKALAIELAARDSETVDPGFLRGTTSKAVRHLIEKDRARRQKDKEGNPLFGAGPGQIRTLSMQTGITTVQTFEEVVDLTRPAKSRGRR